jgi:hypothetical protein
MINDRYMDLVKDEYKESYIAYRQGKRLIPYSTHQPVLIHVLNTIKEGNVLEYGMGWNSTPIMHLICLMQRRKLLSVETDINWFNKYTQFQYGGHELLHLTEQELCRDKYSVAFIDGHPNEARQTFIEKIKDNVDYFVIHDTEEYARGFVHPTFTYKWDFSGFKHVFHLQKGDPVTSLISNLDVIDKDLITIFND